MPLFSLASWEANKLYMMACIRVLPQQTSSKKKKGIKRSFFPTPLRRHHASAQTLPSTQFIFLPMKVSPPAWLWEAQFVLRAFAILFLAGTVQGSQCRAAPAAKQAAFGSSARRRDRKSPCRQQVCSTAVPPPPPRHWEAAGFGGGCGVWGDGGGKWGWGGRGRCALLSRAPRVGHRGGGAPWGASSPLLQCQRGDRGVGKVSVSLSLVLLCGGAGMLAKWPCWAEGWRGVALGPDQSMAASCTSKCQGLTECHRSALLLCIPDSPLLGVSVPRGRHNTPPVAQRHTQNCNRSFPAVSLHLSRLCPYGKPCHAMPLPALQRLQPTPIPRAVVLMGPASLPAPLPRSPPTPAACPGRCEKEGTCQAPQLALRGYNGSLFPLAPLSHPTALLCSDLIFLSSLPPHEARATPPPAPALCSMQAPQGGPPAPCPSPQPSGAPTHQVCNLQRLAGSGGDRASCEIHLQLFSRIFNPCVPA